ncbi:hypothetical protein DBQ68_15025 [Lactobacillus sp. DS15_6]|nr:hypothetical protein Lpp78_06327 [Lacticaseibacillus paracasei subsp. paracasei CNCM I-2877]KAA1048825.1 hypothetical protein F0640_05600 [Lacticaseibacillus paracasei]PTS47724.1 hypothetical protein DBQ69_01210 [Lactobacillus sp. DS1_6]PTS47802.1 hypothetical protein DBQ62_15120 [Lactobacillus sp. DS9_6]PTS54453.1 hypothetical protein DBQ60_00065 [Lactobacillus sp. DS2_6]PTS57717.1 hypothetical protein DBQ68_15025 [Lactobacillus sp. DS15_6]PTS68087.1 hypothetical protein DBQ65_14455 [Lact
MLQDTMVRVGVLALVASSTKRSQSQKPPHKDLRQKWPKSSHFCLSPLMFRFLNVPAHALKSTNVIRIAQTPLNLGNVFAMIDAIIKRTKE